VASCSVSLFPSESNRSEILARVLCRPGGSQLMKGIVDP